MTRRRLLAILAHLAGALTVCFFLAWMIDKTVSRYQEQWERRTQVFEQAEPQGLGSPRPSGGN